LKLTTLEWKVLLGAVYSNLMVLEDYRWMKQPTRHDYDSAMTRDCLACVGQWVEAAGCEDIAY
jgi:hypothetical protein